MGGAVVGADLDCDWIGVGIAGKLARDGCHVRLAVTGFVSGERMPSYVRDSWNAILHKLGVEIIPYAKLFGADSDTVYMRHTASGEPIIFEAVDTLVLAQGHDSRDELSESLTALAIESHRIGDCLSPRTAEEAVLEGLKVAAVI